MGSPLKGVYCMVSSSFWVDKSARVIYSTRGSLEVLLRLFSTIFVSVFNNHISLHVPHHGFPHAFSVGSSVDIRSFLSRVRSLRDYFYGNHFSVNVVLLTLRLSHQFYSASYVVTSPLRIYTNFRRNRSFTRIHDRELLRDGRLRTFSFRVILGLVSNYVFVSSLLHRFLIIHCGDVS